MPAPPQEPREGYIAVGRVLRPWGLRGVLKVEPLTDFPERFAPGARLWLAGTERIVERARWQKGALYLKLADIDDATAAEAARDHLLEIPESDLHELEPDEYYLYQLVGLTVRAADGTPLGVVREVLTTAGNAVLVVSGERGEALLPFVEDVILAVDLEHRQIEVDAGGGLLDWTATRPPRPPRAPRRRRPRRN